MSLFWQWLERNCLKRWSVRILDITCRLAWTFYHQACWRRRQSDQMLQLISNHYRTPDHANFLSTPALTAKVAAFKALGLTNNFSISLVKHATVPWAVLVWKTLDNTPVSQPGYYPNDNVVGLVRIDLYDNGAAASSAPPLRHGSFGHAAAAAVG